MTALSHPTMPDVIDFPREQILGNYAYPWTIRNRIPGMRMCNARLIPRVSIKISGFLTRSNPHTGAGRYLSIAFVLFFARASLSRISYSIAKSPPDDLLIYSSRYLVTREINNNVALRITHRVRKSAVYERENGKTSPVRRPRSTAVSKWYASGMSLSFLSRLIRWLSFSSTPRIPEHGGGKARVSGQKIKSER